jgi:hypothetical protein
VYTTIRVCSKLGTKCAERDQGVVYVSSTELLRKEEVSSNSQPKLIVFCNRCQMDIDKGLEQSKVEVLKTHVG